MARLSQAFEEKLVAPREFAVSRAQSIADIGSGSSDLGQAAVSASTDTMRVSYRVDYSQYENYVFFNSALDYFNISGEKILNEYPTRGTYTDVLSFMSGCDDYQRWLVENSWPAVLGDNNGNPGYTNDTLDKFAPATSSFSIEFDTYSADNQMYSLAEKEGSWVVYTSSSNTFTGSICFEVTGTSGSAGAVFTMHPNEIFAHTTRHFVFVCDREAEEIRIIGAPQLSKLYTTRYVSGVLETYNTGTVVLASASIAGIGELSGSGKHLTIASGTFGDSYVIANFAFWNKVRTVEDVRTSYAGNFYAQDGLMVLYLYDEITPTGSLYKIRNSAGEGFDNFLDSNPGVKLFSGTKGKSFYGSIDAYLTASRTPRPLTTLTGPGNILNDYIVNNQFSATLYDKDNTNIITRLVPEAYFQLEQEMNTEVLQNFLYIIARQFDQIKVAIDQFSNWNKSNYTGFNDTPDALLKDAANFYGWDFVGNFLNQDAIKYFFGKGVVPGADLDMKLYQIKNEFWRRTLNELMHIYKTKGTRESVESLIRVYGLDNKLVKLKEYGVKPNGQVKTMRINSHRSLPAYRLRADTNDTITSLPLTGFNGWEVSMHTKFVPFSTTGSVRGTLFSIGPYELRYYSSAGNQTASLMLCDTATNVTGAVGSAPIMDGHWWNIFATIPASGSGGQTISGFSYPFAVGMGGDPVPLANIWLPGILVQRLDNDAVVDRYTLTGTYTTSTLSGTTFSATLGHLREIGGTVYVNEVKLYNDYLLSYNEMDAQTLDFQCYGVDDIDDLTGSLRMHWRLDDDFRIPSGVNPSSMKVFDFSGYGVSGTVSSTLSLASLTEHYAPFQRFLFDYNFIAPVEYGWNEDKIRVYDGSVIPSDDHFNEANALALEFNLVDALNEDISKMLSTMDNWNNILGVPANKYRDSYPDLNKFRNYYFKKLQGRINFRQFADILEFFDRSFVKMVQRLLPARAVFYGEEFVIESHMLERPKVQWAYRRYSPELVPEGIILMTDRSGSDNAVPSTTRYFG